MGTPMVILNSLQVCTELFDKRSIKYSSRPRQPMLGELYVPLKVIPLLVNSSPEQNGMDFYLCDDAILGALEKTSATISSKLSRKCLSCSPPYSATWHLCAPSTTVQRTRATRRASSTVRHPFVHHVLASIDFNSLLAFLVKLSQK
jgi:hypothetical protein